MERKNTLLEEDKYDREKVILHFKIPKIKNQNSPDLLSTYIILAEKFDNTITEIGRTEVQEWTENPDFTSTFVVDFVFERKQRFKAQIISVESTRKRPVKEGEKSKLSNNEGKKVGYVDFYLHSLFNQKKLNTDFEIIPEDEQLKVEGIVNVRLQKYNINPYKFSFIPKGKNMTNFGLLSKITPTIYFLKPILTPEQRNLIISGKKDFKDFNVTKWKRVAEVKGQGSEFTFKKIESDSWKFLACGSLESPICIQLYNAKKGSLKLKGQKTVKFTEIGQEGGNYFQLMCPKRKKSAGALIIDDFNFERIYSFSDFLQSGLDISVSCCLDFTTENKPYENEASLHFLDPNPKKRNCYQKVIRAICSSLLHYDSDGLVHGFGFGAKLSPDSEINHCFPLGLEGNSETLSKGYEDFWEKYDETVKKIEFGNEAKLAPVVQEMIKFCSEKAKESLNNYTVVTIMTTGKHSDHDELIDNIVKASFFPISILFIGMGDGNFKDMEVFNQPRIKNSDGNIIQREVTKFVKFNDFTGMKGSDLTAAIMGNIPEQIVSYYRLIGQEPKLPEEQKVSVFDKYKIAKKPKEEMESPKEEEKTPKEEIAGEKTEGIEVEVKGEITEGEETKKEIIGEGENPEGEESEPKAVKAKAFKEGEDVVVGHDSDYEEVEIEVEVTDSEGEEDGEYEYVEVEVEVTDSEGEEEKKDKE